MPGKVRIMKVHHVTWRLSNVSIKVEVLTVTGREDEMVVKTAISTLRREGITVNNNIGNPDVKVVYSGPSTLNFPAFS